MVTPVWPSQQHPMCFSQDGKWLAVLRPNAAKDRELLSLFDLRTCREFIEVGSAPMRPNWQRVFTCLTFAADGGTFAYNSWDPDPENTSIVIWDTEKRSERVRIHDKCYCAALSPNGEELATAAWWHEDKAWVRIWNARTGKRLREFLGEERDLFDELVFADDGTTLTGLSADDGPNLFEPLRKVVTLDIRSMKVLTTFEPANGKGPGDPNIGYENPNDSFVPRYIYQSQSDECHKIINLTTGEVQFSLSKNDSASDSFPLLWYSLTPDKSLFVVYQERNFRPHEWWQWIRERIPILAQKDEHEVPVIRIWNIRTGNEYSPLWRCRGPFVISSDSKTLAGLGSDGTIQLWDLPPRKPLGWFLGLASLLLLLTLGGFWWQARRRNRKAALATEAIPCGT
jgi:WD40 repeat protein